jgi:hypothetical protein
MKHSIGWWKELGTCGRISSSDGISSNINPEPRELSERLIFGRKKMLKNCEVPCTRGPIEVREWAVTDRSQETTTYKKLSVPR